jgi:hypothetical protein
MLAIVLFRSLLIDVGLTFAIIVPEFASTTLKKSTSLPEVNIALSDIKLFTGVKVLALFIVVDSSGKNGI